MSGAPAPYPPAPPAPGAAAGGALKRGPAGTAAIAAIVTGAFVPIIAIWRFIDYVGFWDNDYLRTSDKFFSTITMISVVLAGGALVVLGVRLLGPGASARTAASIAFLAGVAYLAGWGAVYFEGDAGSTIRAILGLIVVAAALVTAFSALASIPGSGRTPSAPSPQHSYPPAPGQGPQSQPQQQPQQPAPPLIKQQAPAPSGSGQPAGWYADPSQQGALRWWDGSAWTEHQRAG